MTFYVVTLCSMADGYNWRGEGRRFFRKSARYRNLETSTTFRRAPLPPS